MMVGTQIDRVLMNSLATTVHPDAESYRRSYLGRAHTHAAARSGALMLHRLAVRFPHRTAAYLGADLRRPTDLTYLGSGYESIVFAQPDDTVLKANAHTILLSQSERQRFADKKQREHDILCRFMGERLVLPQTYHLGSHPFIVNKECLQVVQPRQDIFDPELFTNASAPETKEAIVRMESAYPGTTDQLGMFVDNAIKLYRDQMLLPDVAGPGNVIVGSERSLLMIDGSPLDMQLPESQVAGTVALRRFDTVASALATL